MKLGLAGETIEDKVVGIIMPFPRSFARQILRVVEYFGNPHRHGIEMSDVWGTAHMK